MLKKQCVIVPPCPRCESKRTGYYIFTLSGKDENKIIASRMKRGELVKVITGIRDTEFPNFYCEDCGIEWHGLPTTKYLSEEEIQQIKIDKDIEAIDIKILQEPPKKISLFKRNLAKIKTKVKKVKHR